MYKSSLYFSSLWSSLNFIKVVQGYSSVLGLPHEESVMIGGNHSSMCKFDRDDGRFEAVWRAIRRVARNRSDVVDGPCGLTEKKSQGSPWYIHADTGMARQ